MHYSIRMKFSYVSKEKGTQISSKWWTAYRNPPWWRRNNCLGHFWYFVHIQIDSFVLWILVHLSWAQRHISEWALCSLITKRKKLENWKYIWKWKFFDSIRAWRFSSAQGITKLFEMYLNILVYFVCMWLWKPYEQLLLYILPHSWIYNINRVPNAPSCTKYSIHNRFHSTVVIFNSGFSVCSEVPSA